MDLTWWNFLLGRLELICLKLKIKIVYFFFHVAFKINGRELTKSPVLLLEQVNVSVLVFCYMNHEKTCKALLPHAEYIQGVGNCITESLGVEEGEEMLPVRPQGNVHPSDNVKGLADEGLVFSLRRNLGPSCLIGSFIRDLWDHFHSSHSVQSITLALNWTAHKSQIQHFWDIKAFALRFHRDLKLNVCVNVYLQVFLNSLFHIQRMFLNKVKISIFLTLSWKELKKKVDKWSNSALTTENVQSQDWAERSGLLQCSNYSFYLN